MFLYLVSVELIFYVIDSFGNSYNFTIIDLTPVTSMILSFGHILYGISKFENNPFHQYGPAAYLETSFIVQMIAIFLQID